MQKKSFVFSKLKLTMLLHYAPRFIWASIFLLISQLLAGQTTVNGTVTDATTHQPLASVSIQFKGSRRGATSGNDGKFTLTSDGNFTQIQFSYVGYKPLYKTVQAGKTQTVEVELEISTEISNVTVKPHKVKYRNKDNPAVELIRKVIDNKDSNQTKAYNSASYQQYEKMQLAISNMADKLQKSKLLHRFSFMLNDKDTTMLEAGRSTIPVYLEETLSQNYRRKNPDKKKQIILAEKRVDFGGYVDNAGIKTYLNYLYQDINVYDNNILLLNSQFLSPIAGAAPTFYMYTIMDTVQVNGDSLIKLNFDPRNPADLLFRGTMFITMDGKYAVKKINLTVSKYANLNWVREMHIAQQFQQDSLTSRYYLSKSEVNADFGLSKNKKAGGIYGERSISFKNFETGKPLADSLFDGESVVKLPQTATTDSFLVSNRHDSLSASEASVYKNIDSLVHMKSFRTVAGLIELVSSGYVKTGPLEFGPLATFYGYNPVEGLRIRFGGRTRIAPYFSDKVQLEGYGAYGFKDQRFKYYGGITYSLTDRNIFQFPVKYIKFSYLNDTRVPGQELQLVNEDNTFLSFTRGINDRFLYNKTYRVEWQNEMKNHFTYNIIYKNWQQEAGGGLNYSRMENGIKIPISSITSSEIAAEFRWAPGEQFYQGKIYRVPIINKYPIFRWRLAAGISGFLGGEYSYKNLGMSVEKRFFLSQLGFIDAVAETGTTLGKVPYPLLTIHRANQTYAYFIRSYNLMNFLEFVSDHYASLNLDYKLNGFLLNKIPLVKKLKWREAISFKILTGGLRKENNPNVTPGLIEFSTTNGVPNTYALGRKPYMEGSIGLLNVFKVLRLDVVRRFSYLNHPNVDKWGLRGWVRLMF